MTRMTHTDAVNSHAPGRLGEPTMGPGTDPRTDGILRPTLIEAGLGEALLTDGTDRPSDPSALAAIARESHDYNEEFAGSVSLELPGDDALSVVQRSGTAVSTDGRKVDLQVYRPVQSTGSLPCVIYLHGGAMVFAATRNRVHDQWCLDLAAQGAVVIQVDFRNAWTPDGFNPYPAGLMDCFAALAWTHERRDELGIRSIVVEGESGGGNLALATALKAKRDGALEMIDGVYAKAPMISNAYGWDHDRRIRELPSLVENDGYFGMDTWSMDALASIYDPADRHAHDPLAWPYFASKEDVAGLPPHVISVDELDPLRDEGTAYQRLLTEAGVSARGVLNLGLTHCADFTYRQAMTPHYRALVRDIVHFASSLQATS